MTSIPVSIGDTEFCHRCASMNAELTRQIDAFETLFTCNPSLKADILIVNFRQVLKKFSKINQPPSITPAINSTTLSLPTTNIQLQPENTVVNEQPGTSHKPSTPTTIVQSQSNCIASCSSQKADKLNPLSANQKNKRKNYSKKRNIDSLTEDACISEKENNEEKEESEVQPLTLTKPKSKRGRKQQKKDQDVTESSDQISQTNVSNFDDLEASDGEVINLNKQKKVKRRKALPQTPKRVQQKGEGIKKKRRKKKKLLFSSQRQRVTAQRSLYARQVKSAGQRKRTKVTTDSDNDEDEGSNRNNDDNSKVDTSANNNNDDANNGIPKMETEAEMNQVPSISEDNILTHEKLKRAYSEIRNRRVTMEDGRICTVYECLLCHKNLTVKLNAALHIRRVHYKDRASCLSCGKTFYDWGKLSDHRGVCPAKIGNLRPATNFRSRGNNIQNDNEEEKMDVNMNSINNNRGPIKKKQATIKRKIQKRRPQTRKNPIKRKKLIKKLKSTINEAHKNNNNNIDDDAESNVNFAIGQRAVSPTALTRNLVVKNASPCFDLKKAINVRVTMDRLNLNSCKTPSKLHVERQQQKATSSNLNEEAFSPSLETNDFNNNTDDDGDGDEQLDLFSRVREYSPDIINPPANYKIPRRSRKTKSRARKEMEHGTQTDFPSDPKMRSLITSSDSFIPSSSTSDIVPYNSHNELVPSKSNQITQYGSLSSYLPMLQFMGNQNNVETATTDQQQQNNLTLPSLQHIHRNFKNTGTNTNADEIFPQEQDENEDLLLKEEQETEGSTCEQRMNSESPRSFFTHANDDNDDDDDFSSDLIDGVRIEPFSHLTVNQEDQSCNTNYCDENPNLNNTDDGSYESLHENGDDVQEDEEIENLKDTTSETIIKKKKASVEEVNSQFRNTPDGHQCTHCKKVFSKKISITQHIRFVHLRERDSECRFCGKIYATQSLMLKHQRQCSTLHNNETE